MLGFLKDLAMAFAMSGSDEDKSNGGPGRNSKGGHKPLMQPGGGAKKCDMCRSEPASGTRKMADGTWKRVGTQCKKSMGNPRVNIIAEREKKERRKAERAARKKI